MGEGGALLVAGVLLGTVSGLVPRAASAAFVPGHLYTTGEDYPPAISEFDASGRPLDTLILPDGIGGAPRGLTFGPDGLLYVILAADNGFAVVALDHCGVVQATYRGDDYLQGDSLSGRLVVAADAIYVAARAHVVRFDRSQPGRGSIIYETDGVRDVVDVVQLPSGNLLVASEQDIDEITLLGVELPREDPVWISAGYIRGLAYDPIGDDIYVSQWGFSDVGHRVLRVDAASGAVKGAVAITYPSDLLWTSTGTLLLTLRFGPALRYSAQSDYSAATRRRASLPSIRSRRSAATASSIRSSAATTATASPATVVTRIARPNRGTSGCGRPRCISPRTRAPGSAAFASLPATARSSRAPPAASTISSRRSPSTTATAPAAACFGCRHAIRAGAPTMAGARPS
jgi:hypothetical protein